MKILVPLKRVLDHKLKVQVRADQTGIELANAMMVMNPFDEIAVEEAVRQRECGLARETVAVSCGPLKCQDTLRTALAIGVDRAIHIETDVELQPLAVARLLKEIVLRERPQLVMMGKQAIDDDSAQVGQMLAALLGWPQACFASKVRIDDDRHVIVTREIDGGLETLEVKIPAVITTDLRLNEPRYATLPNIMRARKKPLERLSLDELGVSTEVGLKTLKVTEASRRAAGVRLSNAAELVERLRSEARVL